MYRFAAQCITDGFECLPRRPVAKRGKDWASRRGRACSRAYLSPEDSVILLTNTVGFFSVPNIASQVSDFYYSHKGRDIGKIHRTRNKLASIHVSPSYHVILHDGQPE